MKRTSGLTDQQVEERKNDDAPRFGTRKWGYATNATSGLEESDSNRTAEAEDRASKIDHDRRDDARPALVLTTRINPFPTVSPASFVRALRL